MPIKKIAVIGVGGRTGTMFAQELSRAGKVIGISREKEVKLIKQKKLYIKKQGGREELFKTEVIQDFEFPAESLPDIIFLTTKNPVAPVIKYYYQKIKNYQKLPVLALSQNGIVAADDALNTLKEIFGDKVEKIQIIRISLFNPIDREEKENKTYIKYSLPIRIAFSKVSGQNNLKEISDLFKKAGFEAEKLPFEQRKNMELSKLFLNLIGMASASRGLSVEEGFKNLESFKEEIFSLREFIKVVRVKNQNFINFSHYPVKLLASLIYYLPIGFLSFFRNQLARIINKGRKRKAKDLDEINYYNGAVIKLGKNLGVPTPINQEILKRAKSRG